MSQKNLSDILSKDNKLEEVNQFLRSLDMPNRDVENARYIRLLQSCEGTPLSLPTKAYDSSGKVVVKYSHHNYD